MLLVYVIVHIIIHVILILIPQPIHVTYVHIIVIIVIVATNETDNPNAWGFQSTVFYALNPLWSFPLREV